MIAILDIMGSAGSIFWIAVLKNMKVAMLTAHAMNPEALKRSYDKKPGLPAQGKVGRDRPFLETCSNTNIARLEAPHGELEGYLMKNSRRSKDFRSFSIGWTCRKDEGVATGAHGSADA